MPVSQWELFRVEELTVWKFETRVNRFVVRVSRGDAHAIALLRNTGRLLELRDGLSVLCAPKSRGKTSLLLVAAECEDGFVLLDTVTQSRAFEVAHSRGFLPWLGWRILRREVTVDDSRLDYEIGKGRSRGYLELKSAALTEGTFASYPDCPSDRGAKHIRRLIEVASTGRRSVMLFIATNPRVTRFWPNWNADERICLSLVEAEAAGVEIRCMKAVLSADGAVRLESPDIAVDLSRSRQDRPTGRP